MPLTAVLQAVADAAVDSLVNQLAARQMLTRRRTGKYRQCIRGQDWESWENQKPDPATGVTAWIDEYVGPAGVGYTVWGEVTELGAVYRRSFHAGPETYRDVEGWQEVQPERI